MMMEQQVMPQGDLLHDHHYFWLFAFGRLKPGVLLEQARAIPRWIQRRYSVRPTGGPPLAKRYRAISLLHQSEAIRLTEADGGN